MERIIRLACAVDDLCFADALPEFNPDIPAAIAGSSAISDAFRKLKRRQSKATEMSMVHILLL